MSQGRSTLPPRKKDWVQGTYQVGLFMRTAEGNVVEFSRNNANAEMCALASLLIAEAFLGKDKPKRSFDEWVKTWEERIKKSSAAVPSAAEPANTP